MVQRMEKPLEVFVPMRKIFLAAVQDQAEAADQ